MSFHVPADIFRDFPEVNKIYDMFTLACHPDYRGRGIATELVRQALKVKKIQQMTILLLIQAPFLSTAYKLVVLLTS